MRRVVTQGEHFSQTPFPTAKSHRIHHYGTRTIQGEHPSAGRRRLQATGGEQVLGGSRVPPASPLACVLRPRNRAGTSPCIVACSIWCLGLAASTRRREITQERLGGPGVQVQQPNRCRGPFSVRFRAKVSSYCTTPLRTRRLKAAATSRSSGTGGGTVSDAGQVRCSSALQRSFQP